MEYECIVDENEYGIDKWWYDIEDDNGELYGYNEWGE